LSDGDARRGLMVFFAGDGGGGLDGKCWSVSSGKHGLAATGESLGGDWCRLCSRLRIGQGEHVGMVSALPIKYRTVYQTGRFVSAAV
jgi:hypothetical protein